MTPPPSHPTTALQLDILNVKYCRMILCRFPLLYCTSKSPDAPFLPPSLHHASNSICDTSSLAPAATSVARMRTSPHASPSIRYITIPRSLPLQPQFNTPTKLMGSYFSTSTANQTTNEMSANANPPVQKSDDEWRAILSPGTSPPQLSPSPSPSPSAAN